MPTENREVFASQLNGALYAIKWREGKTLGAIQDELGYAIGRTGGSAISHWRRGHIPAKFADIDALAQEIYRRIDLGRDWAIRYYRATGISDYESRAAALSSGRVSVAWSEGQQNAPERRSRHVIGRQDLIDELLDVLRDVEGPSIITIDGMGGIGKTALLAELSQLCLEEKLCEDLVQITAATNTYPLLAPMSADALTLDALLNRIGEQLRIPQIARFTQEEKLTRIRTALANRSVIFVIDNLETSQIPQKDVAEILRTLLGPNKAILASRHRFSGDYRSIHLQGLSGEEGIDFLHKQAEHRGIHRVASADHQDLQNISIATGGSPLAMKLVLGQLVLLELPTVLTQLKYVQPHRINDGQDEYMQLYRYIFMPSWKVVELPAQQLLVGMANFAPGAGDDVDIVQEVCELSDAEMVRAISQLWLTSLLEVDESSSVNHVRYYLHALTQYFVLSDIVRDSRGLTT